MDRTLTLSILDLGLIETALEAYIEDNVDTRMHWDEANVEPEEKAEVDTCIEEATALLARVVAAQGR